MARRCWHFAVDQCPEMIDPGVTGIIVEGMQDAASALPQVLALDRRAVRRRFEERFSAARMAKDYVKLYRSMHEAGCRRSFRMRRDRARTIAVKHSARGPSLNKPALQPDRTAGRPGPGSRFLHPRHRSCDAAALTLKHGDTFIVADSHGDIGASAGGPDGIFHADTRFLSRCELLLNGMQLMLLGSNVRDDNAVLTVDLTNPDIYFEQKRVLNRRTRCTSCERCFSVSGHGLSAFRRPQSRRSAHQLRLSLAFANDFADVFEVRGIRRRRRGTATTEIDRSRGRVVLRYQGLDGRIRAQPC